MHLNKSVKYILISIFLLIALAGFGNAQPDNKITIVLRMDDYSNFTSDSFIIQILDLFNKHNIACTFGVIPYLSATGGHNVDPNDTPLSKSKINILKEADSHILEVALHGYSHQARHTCFQKYRTEFNGIDYINQVKRIDKGKIFLEYMLNTTVKTFIPPWSTYDLDTLKAINKLGFHSISSDAEQGRVFKSVNLKYLPATTTLQYVKEAVQAARILQDKDNIIVILFHLYDFMELSREHGITTYKALSDNLNWLTRQDDIQFLTLGQAADKFNKLDADRFSSYISFIRSYSFLPPFFRPNIRHVYVNTHTSSRLRIMGWIFTSIFYIIIIFLTISLTSIIFQLLCKRSIVLQTIVRYTAPSLMLLFLFIALQDLLMGYKEALLLAVFFGISAGTWRTMLTTRLGKLYHSFTLLQK